jgi:hypothetical protein
MAKTLVITGASSGFGRVSSGGAASNASSGRSAE